MVKAGVPDPFRPYPTKSATAIEGIDQIITGGTDDEILGDACVEQCATSNGCVLVGKYAQR
jgi:hypothetical protein